MIPKILHFIWFGDKRPDYCQFSIDNFHNVNPGFAINTYFRSIHDIESLHEKDYSTLNNIDVLIKKCIDAIVNMNTDYNIQIYNSRDVFKMNFIQVLADIFRLEVLNTYGGIYLDCDTFPVRPFDNIIDMHDFTVARHNTQNKVIPDYFFIAKSKESQRITTYLSMRTLLQTQRSWWNNIKFIQNKHKFFKCQLKIGDYSFSKDFNIEHYNDNTWRKNKFGQNRTPKCKFDKDNTV